jgi:prevent-host-death family protein
MKYTFDQARANFSRLLREACAGEEVTITCGKHRAVKLVPIATQSAPRPTEKDRVPGRLKGKIFFSPDAFDPLTDVELKELGFE